MKTAKKIIIPIIIVFTVIFISFSIKAASPVKLSVNKKTLCAGEGFWLRVIGGKGKISWTSNHKNIASVSDNGYVRAKKAGKAVITAKIKNKMLKCKVIVLPAKGSKKNPFSLYEKQEVTYSDMSLNTPCTFEIQLLSCASKKEGNKVMSLYSGQNASPEKGQSWIVLKFQVKYIAGPPDTFPARQLFDSSFCYGKVTGTRAGDYAEADFGSLENTGFTKCRLIKNQTAEVLVARLTDTNCLPLLYRIPYGLNEGKLLYRWYTTENKEKPDVE